MAHSSTLINGSIDEDPENQAAARSFLRFVEDSESLETDFWLCGGSARVSIDYGLLIVSFFQGEEEGRSDSED